MNCISGMIKGGKFFCTATEYEQCAEKRCAFCTSIEQKKKSLAKAHARLNSLPFADQRRISDTYYDGLMPWR